MAGQPRALDRAIILALHGAGPAWLHHAMVDVTALGGGTVLTLAVAGAAGLLAVRGLWLTSLLTIAAAASGGVAIHLLKALFGRARPDIVDPIVVAAGYSFPSGHSANSAIVYITIAAMTAQVTRNRAARRYLVAAALALVAAIGISRIHLGVHWPSDVVAGWSFGALWAIGWWIAGARARAALLRQRE